MIVTVIDDVEENHYQKLKNFVDIYVWSERIVRPYTFVDSECF